MRKLPVSLKLRLLCFNDIILNKMSDFLRATTLVPQEVNRGGFFFPDMTPKAEKLHFYLTEAG